MDNASSQVVFVDMSCNSVGKEWEVLAKNLGLTSGRVQALKTRNKLTPERLKEDMLYTWIKRQPHTAERVGINWCLYFTIIV